MTHKYNYFFKLKCFYTDMLKNKTKTKLSNYFPTKKIQENFLERSLKEL